ncbi:MAG: response regulator transcription factor, partial [Dehalococcoidia bacterium]|nr:response regulator transcription factor [Dehalococcoidia bacterium]
MSPSKITVLTVDDDTHILRMLQRILELEGFDVLTAQEGDSALNVFVNQKPDVALLDVRMPGMDGYELCRKIREFSEIPIIMVTAKGNEEEKVQGFDAGADDYVTKPFSARELVARVNAVLRRTSWQEDKNKPTFSCKDLTIDFTRQRVKIAGSDVNLTATEYAILSYLAQNAGCLITPDSLLRKVWGEEYAGETHLLQ